MPSTISAGTTAGTAIAIAGDTTGNLAFQTNGTTTAMTIDTSQNVAVGTTTALGTASGRGNITINGSSGSILSFGTGGSLRSYIFQDSTTMYLNNSSSGSMNFDVNGAERMRIDSSGRVTTPFQPGIGIILVNQVFSAATAGFYKPTTYTTTYNVGGGFNPTGGPSSSFRYTAPVAGRYFIQWSVMGNDGSARMEVCVLKNGGDFINGDSNTSKYANAVVASIQYLAANDYLDFRINQGDYYSGVNANPCLSIHLIG